MYNDFELGGYLAWTGYPAPPRVRRSPAAGLPARSFHAVMGRGDLTRAEWDAVMDRHGVDSALLSYAGINRRLAWWDPARWALVYRQGDARVFVRRLPRHAALIAAREIPASFAFTVEDGTRTLPLADPPAHVAGAACEWQLRLGDLLFELDGGEPTRALAAYRRALAAPPGCLDRARAAAAHGWVGTTLLSRGDAGGALDALDRALALSTGADRRSPAGQPRPGAGAPGPPVRGPRRLAGAGRPPPMPRWPGGRATTPPGCNPPTDRAVVQRANERRAAGRSPPAT